MDWIGMANFSPQTYQIDISHIQKTTKYDRCQPCIVLLSGERLKKDTMGTNFEFFSWESKETRPNATPPQERRP